MRRAERAAREARALEIENKRRAALGLETVASLDDLDGGEEEEPSAESDPVADAEVATDNTRSRDKTEVVSADDLASDDVLLSEAGSILVDSLVLQEQAYALTAPKQQ